MIKEISVVLPSLDEEESLPDLVNEIISEFEGKAIAYEIIIVDDGSKVHVDQLFDKYKNVKVIRNEVINPKVIIHPKSIIGLMPLKIKERKAQIVVNTV